MNHNAYAPRRHRLWPVFVAPALFFLAAIAWCGFWFYAASQADEQFDGWRAREARSGRAYDCERQSVGGFPFRLELRCVKPVVSLTAQTAEQLASGAPLTARLSEILAVAQIYDPSRAIAEFKGPATLAESGQTPFATANWQLGRASVGGLLSAPERISLEFDALAIDRVGEAAQSPLFRAGHAEWHGRVTKEAATDHPLIEGVLQLKAASLQGGHPLLAQPFEAEIRASLRGLKDFGPKSWPERFRDIHAAGGRLDFTHSRVQQGDSVAVAAGALSLTASGHLDGELQMTVAGLEQLVPMLGLDKMLEEGPAQAEPGQAQTGDDRRGVNKLIGALDRAIPGLGNVVRRNANAGVVAGINLLGQPTTLEGRPARALTLKFVDGAVILGPFRLAQTPPLF